MTRGDTHWVKEAICAQTDPDSWVAENLNTVNVKQLKSICGTCPVNIECLTFAINEHLEYGIWGGKTPRERAAIRKASR